MTSSGGDLDAGLKGAATALMFYGVGSAAPYNGSATQAANPMGNVLGHAAVGCVSATMSGGDCGAGAVSAGLADYASNNMPGLFDANVAGRTAYVAIVGGTTSVIAGGKFANGAQTAAFGYLFNSWAHRNGELVWVDDCSCSRIGTAIRKFVSDFFNAPSQLIDGIFMKDPPVPDAVQGQETKGRTTNWVKPGGLDAANDDFDGMKPLDVKPIGQGGRTGVLPDGRKVNVRPNSTDGRPTLEIQDGKSRDKIRYEQ
jgi:hypothetical protein